jgi:hypothetical protein
VPVFIVTFSRMRLLAPMIQARALALELQVLRHLPERGERIDDSARADVGPAGDGDVAFELDAFGKGDFRPDQAEWSDLATCADLGPASMTDDGWTEAVGSMDMWLSP